MASSPFRLIFPAALMILLPTIIFASVVVAFNAYNNRRAVEAETLERARRVMNDIDADLARTTASIRVLATSSGIKERDWARAGARAREIMQLNDDWRSVTLFDVERGAIVFTTVPEQPPLADSELQQPPAPGQVRFGGIAPRPGRCTCALAMERLAGDFARYVLVVELDPARIQRIMLGETPPGAVSGVVDREGHFLGRSVDFARRVGTPATVYVRSALNRGTEGFYEGKTYEGLVNLTAFAKSPVTGWSTHMAVSSRLIAIPRQQMNLAVALAALLAVAFAAAALWFMLRNLRQRRLAEARLTEMQHLEALGRLTGGAAHDFNNMLSIISGHLELAQRSPDLAAGVRRHLQAASQGAERAAALTQRMLAYARRQELKPSLVDPCELVATIGDLLDRTMGDHIRVRCEAPEGSWTVFVDRAELENAIVNLTVNARDAMPEGGEVIIVACNATSGVHVGGLPVPEDSVVFSVRDSGDGIPQDIIRHVTNPFFTTKAAGKGTGLGLSQVLGFAKQSGGDLRIESDPGQGTCVSLILPRHVPTTEGTHE